MEADIRGSTNVASQEFDYIQSLLSVIQYLLNNLLFYNLSPSKCTRQLKKGTEGRTLVLPNNIYVLNSQHTELESGTFLREKNHFI